MADPVEIRNDPDGDPEVIVAHSPIAVHLERMDRDAAWMSIELCNGRTLYVDFWVQFGALKFRPEFR